ncbi:MAG: hypothetical protein M5U01_03540 [Ardenticatenaceae bacterium]|nr:hypothetical protein [Ardenticatenaceae bacterium]
MRRLSGRGHLAVAAFYLVAGALLWWPLPLHLTTHVPGSPTWAFDEYTFLWNLWWFKAALLRFGTNPLHSDFIFHPLGIDLVLYTYNLGNALLAFPLLDVLGPVLTSNLFLLGMTALSGWGTFLLVRWLLATEGPGLPSPTATPHPRPLPSWPRREPGRSTRSAPTVPSTPRSATTTSRAPAFSRFSPSSS